MRFSRGNSPVSAIVTGLLVFGTLGLFGKEKVENNGQSPIGIIISLLVFAGMVNMLIQKTNAPFWLVVVGGGVFGIIATMQNKINKKHGIK